MRRPTPPDHVVPNVEDSRMGRVAVGSASNHAAINTADTLNHPRRHPNRKSVEVLWESYIAAMCGIPVLERHSFSVMGTRCGVSGWAPSKQW